MITTNGLKVFAAAMASTVTKGGFIVDGKTVEVPVEAMSVEGDTFTVSLYLDDTVVGKVTVARLYDKNGTVLVDRPDSVMKPQEKALLVVFKIKISEVTP